MSLSKLQKIVKDREARHAAVHRVAKSWTRFSDKTSLFIMDFSNNLIKSKNK